MGIATETLYHPITGEELATVPAATADAGPAETSPAKPSMMGSFDFAAAGTVFKDKGTIELNGIFGLGGVDVDGTIKANSIQVNLEALEAGYKGTASAGTVKEFKDIILAHPDLAKSAEAMIKDEGENVINGMQQLLTGEGAMDMAAFRDAMNDPAKRAMVAQAFDKVGTNEFGMEYAVEFSRNAMAAIKDPAKNGQEFLKTAQKAGINTSELEQQNMMAMFKDFWSNPAGSIAGLFEKIDLPPDLKAGLTSIVSNVVGFYKEAFDHYAFGGDGGPGLVDIAKKGWGSAIKDGYKTAQENGVKFTAPPAAAPAVT